MNKPKAEDLIQKYAQGLCTPEEKAIVESGFLSDLKSNNVNVSAEDVEFASHRMLKNINDHIYAVKTHGNKTYTLFSRAIAVAATLLLIAGFGWLFYENYQPDVKQDATYSNTIKPGGNKAYLTLADGTRIVLTDAANGEIARQSGIKITKAADGQVIYEITEVQKLVRGVAIYNTIETPKGGQYQLKLPDGTKVWLNAGSSLRFPTSFAALEERKVHLNGEAYFEVAKDKSKVFLVSTVNQVI
ncbi:MAG: FecR domain-containing protein, partial [Sphingobacteriaceae bacterium]